MTWSLPQILCMRDIQDRDTRRGPLSAMYRFHFIMSFYLVVLLMEEILHQLKNANIPLFTGVIYICQGGCFGISAPSKVSIPFLTPSFGVTEVSGVFTAHPTPDLRVRVEWGSTSCDFFLQETNISHLWKGKIIDSKVFFGRYMLVPRRVYIDIHEYEYEWVNVIRIKSIKSCEWIK